MATPDHRPMSNIAVVVARGTDATDTIFNANSPACEVIDAWGVMTAAGGAGDGFSVTDGTSDIVTNILCDDSTAPAKDGDIVRARNNASTAEGIDDTKRTLAAGSTLKVVRASAAPVDVYVMLRLLDGYGG